MRLQFVGSGDAFGSGGGFNTCFRALIDVSREADLFIVEALSFEKRISQHLDYAAFHANAPRLSASRI
jgi:hypothetical protein